jgi:hypothetical protein
MRRVEARLVDRACGAQDCNALKGSAAAGELQPLQRMRRGTPLNLGVGSALSGNVSGELWLLHRKIAITSGWPAVSMRRDRPLRKKIIGHARSALRQRFASWLGFRCRLRALPLIHQQTSEHGLRILLHPFVEKRSDLLAEIGGMAEPREFKALQRVARSGEQELPRRLRLISGHVGLQGSDRHSYALNNSGQ